ncbi:TIGR00730 family Rossman fold protein [Candidatus Gastranaerophilales bacterium]|nr:MAG: TIGR00730 family Rossman fold protein [Candidatus Gastranaerophilales bacterium]
MIKNVCVFASSSGKVDRIYFEEADKLGKLLAKSGYNLVYGGSSLGLMWACAGAAKHSGAKIYGIMPEKLYNMGVSTEEGVELSITPCMRTRKSKMDEISDAVVALPGGFGTLEELSEMIVQKQLGYNAKPIVILNINGFYDKLIEFFDEIILQNFGRGQNREIYYVAKSSDDAVEYLKHYKPDAVPVSKEDIYVK